MLLSLYELTLPRAIPPKMPLVYSNNILGPNANTIVICNLLYINNNTLVSKQFSSVFFHTKDMR